MVKEMFLTLVFVFRVVINVPSLTPLILGATRTEIIEEIWERLNQIRGNMVPLFGFGRPVSHNNERCTLTWADLTPVPQPVGKARYQIHFRKDDFPGHFGQDQRDDARVNVIFAAETNGWQEAVPINQPQNFYSDLEDRYIGQIGFAACRRQKIEWVKLEYNGHYCDIETWLIFLCMIDECRLNAKLVLNFASVLPNLRGTFGTK